MKNVSIRVPFPKKVARRAALQRVPYGTRGCPVEARRAARMCSRILSMFLCCYHVGAISEELAWRATETAAEIRKYYSIVTGNALSKKVARRAAKQQVPFRTKSCLIRGLRIYRK